jgi:hypothetical protein
MREELSTIQPTTNGKIWQAHLKAWQKSGLSRAEYCRRHNISYDTLTYWKKKTDRKKKATTHFVSVPAVRINQEITAHNHTAALKIDLGARLKIEVHDGFTPATLSRILSTLKDC